VLPDGRASLGAPGRIESVAVLVAAAVIFVLYVWSSRYWLDLIDEGYFIYLSSRVQAGDLPYRDFDTYYTPGIFYLYAWTFNLFGVTVMPIRILMSAVRVLWALLLYRLTRRVAPWPFAILPFLVVAAVDAAPVFPEPHPSWPAILATLALIEAIALHQTRGGRRWIVVAGALAGLTFAFKQNLGAFVALAIGAYLLLRPRPQTGRLLLVAQGGFALVLAAAAAVLLWPGRSPQLAATIWLPLLGTLALLLWSAWRQARDIGSPGGWSGSLGPFLLDGMAAGGAFVAVTLAWLIPLTMALGVHGVPWGVFVGNVNQGALILPLDPPPPGTRAVFLTALWLPLVLATVLGRRGLLSRWLVGGLLVASVLILLLPVGYVVDEGLVEDPGFYPWLNVLNDELGGLFVYLPSIGAWVGLAMLLAAVARRAPIEPLAWYLLVGTLTLLGLYPRVDTIHAMFAGPPLLVVGVWGLAWAHRSLSRHLPPVSRVLIYASLLVVPVAAVAPHVYWRYVTVAHADPRASIPPAYVDLGLERAPILMPENYATSIRGAVEYVQAGTPAGAPFFTYPVDPLFNFLADRPNPTRFNHFIAGALTPSDLDDVIRDLERAKPRYILWDHGGATYFKADLTNRPLSDYIWGCYSQVANFTPYLILERRCP
jgi:hypothetical protein